MKESPAQITHSESTGQSQDEGLGVHFKAYALSIIPYAPGSLRLFFLS